MNDYELKKLHNKILEIANYFESFCKANSITYYLMGGSALGAVRHSGFIPWDDDFDVFMDYENYSNFLKVAKTKLDKNKFYLQVEDSEECPLFFSKIRMNNTTFIEKEVRSKKMHHGIYIDVMCLNNASDNKYIRYGQYLAARGLSASALLKKDYIAKTKKDEVLLFFAKHLIKDPIKKKLLQFVRFFNSRNTGLVGHFFGRAPFDKTSFPRSYLGKPRYILFENYRLPVPSKVEGYLSVRYGDNYMQLPTEEEKLKYPSHAYIVDVDNSYEMYLK